MTIKVRNIIEYVGLDGKSPFRVWLSKLKDQKVIIKIDSRLTRVRLGNYGDWKSVGQGVKELRFSFGPGYRIYFGEDGQEIVVLLIGGDKSTQVRDIKVAQKYWKDYLEG